MKTVTRVETFDGEIHPNMSKATRHLDEMYGAIVCEMARKLCSLDRYKDHIEYLETQTETFRQLVQIKDDMTMQRDESED